MLVFINIDLVCKKSWETLLYEQVVIILCLFIGSQRPICPKIQSYS